MPKGSTVLELGSGTTTQELSKFYKVYSIEDDANYLHFNEKENYIYAIRDGDGFYSDSKLSNLPSYDFLFVDGPATSDRMEKFIEHIHFFDQSKTWFLDDLTYEKYVRGFESIQKLFGERFMRFDINPKPFAVILGESK